MIIKYQQINQLTRKPTKIKTSGNTIFYFVLISLAANVGLSMTLAYCLFTSLDNNWKANIDFNICNEGLIELILFPLIVIFGFISLVYLVNNKL